MTSVRAMLPAALLVLLLTACGSNAGTATWTTHDASTETPDTVSPDAADTVPVGPSMDPDHGPQSGYFPVIINLAGTGLDPAAVTGVRVAGILAFGLEPRADGRLKAMVQGAPDPGPAEVVVRTASGPTSLGPIFVYDAPGLPAFRKVAALGASLTEGVQRGVPAFHGGLMGPAARVARVLGGYMPLPLLVPGLFPEITPADIGPPPECTVPDIVKFVEQRSAEVVPKLIHKDTKHFDYGLGRIDPTLAPRNVAVGGSLLGTVLNGPGKNDIGGNFVSHIVYQPEGAFNSPILHSQISLVEAMKPTLVLSVDLFANDVANGIIGGHGIDPARATPMTTLGPEIDEIVKRLAATGAKVFLANMPRPSVLPVTEEKRRAMVADGTPKAKVAALLAAVDQLAKDANARLAAQAGKYANVYVVDLHGAVEELAKNGLDLGGTHLTTDKFGGLLGLDGVHFSDTGYAVVANVFLKAIGRALGVKLPSIGLQAVHAQDPESPDALKAEGLDPAACQ